MKQRLDQDNKNNAAHLNIEHSALYNDIFLLQKDPKSHQEILSSASPI